MLLVRLLKFVKFSHTAFALPFALAAAAVAMSRQWPLVAGTARTPWWAYFAPTLAAILGCMVFARTAAMGFNRLADWEIDRRNPRTAGRHLLVSRQQATGLVIVSSVLFVACTFFLNRLCVVLAPVALTIVFFYSVTKRFTSLTHLFLGLALAVAPVGAWAGVTGDLRDWEPFLLGSAVALWVAGFDIIYAVQDEAFDRAEGLHSLVVRLGVRRALVVARCFHGGMVVALGGFGAVAGLHEPFWTGLGVVVLILIYEHIQARGLDPRSLNEAFFTANAVISIGLFLIGTADIFFL